MARKFDKEALFEDFFNTASSAITTYELTFGINGVWSQVFGMDESNQYLFDDSDEVKQKAQDNLRANYSWERLSYLFDYAVDGLVSEMHPEDMVLGGADIISFITTQTESPSDYWSYIVSMADGRNGLNLGSDLHITKVALLADVDVRTVRNAISAGELKASKGDREIFVENNSAREWLHGRKGFKPTIYVDGKTKSLGAISTPLEFGSFLIARREQMNISFDDKKLASMHQSLNAKVMQSIEQGLFSLPIDAAFAIADLYQVERKELLSCIMKVFYSEQYTILRESIKAG